MESELSDFKKLNDQYYSDGDIRQKALKEYLVAYNTIYEFNKIIDEKCCKKNWYCRWGSNAINIAFDAVTVSTVFAPEPTGTTKAIAGITAAGAVINGVAYVAVCRQASYSMGSMVVNELTDILATNNKIRIAGNVFDVTVNLGEIVASY